MEIVSPRVYTIPPDADFLLEMARAVLRGFPLETRKSPDPLTELPRWTLLVPTRRAARELERHFLAELGGRGGVLPAIRPIGDIDEDLLDIDATDSPTALPLPDAISPLGRELLLLQLIDTWAADNPGSRLAREIAGSPAQSLPLARSLSEFLDVLETEEIDPRHIAALYDLESARHREEILDFLGLIRIELPIRLEKLGLSGLRERQSRILRAEAERLRKRVLRWPIIAAGSTGTIPATRDLLKAIADYPAGAVVLPGLDQGASNNDWLAAGPQHPQFAMKQLLQGLNIDYQSVRPIVGSKHTPRARLAGEIMRTPESSPRWQEVLTTAACELRTAASGIEWLEAADRSEEALAIALMLREAYDHPAKTAALITPDRDLARRVKQELTRWNITIDDSAGEPLVSFQGPALLGLLLELLASGPGIEAVRALILHPLFTMGLAAADANRATRLLDVAMFRRSGGWPALHRLVATLAERRLELTKDRHAHPVFRQFEELDWDNAELVLRRFVTAVETANSTSELNLAGHVEAARHCLESIAGTSIWSDEPGALLFRLLGAIADESDHAGPCDSQRATAILAHGLRGAVYRPSRGQNRRLAIYGLLEARLMRADLHVLGGLNEGIWPALPDAGPWLNRPMREGLSMQQPERSIGQTAHDFVQALGAREVRITWSRRIGNDPANPSRWVLRLRLLLEKNETGAVPRWLQWARALRTAEHTTPASRPAPNPPLAVRPRKLSVTEFEKLIRDPYAIYARHILGLEPLPEISGRPDYRLRGTLYHEVIARFLGQYGAGFPPEPLGRMLEIARDVFAPHLESPLVAAFWWPRFKKIAAAFVTQDRSEIATIQSEIFGVLEIEVAGQPFRITGQADRVDILRSGAALIYDYKTGIPPGVDEVEQGLAPQLMLEAAMVAGGAFKQLGPRRVEGIAYVRLTGGDDPVEVKDMGPADNMMEWVDRQFARARSLLTEYLGTPLHYLPRHIAKSEDAPLTYDHLSRYREWNLAGKRE